MSSILSLLNLYVCMHVCVCELQLASSCCTQYSFIILYTYYCTLKTVDAQYTCAVSCTLYVI
jgi:hypothetical protein